MMQNGRIIEEALRIRIPPPLAESLRRRAKVVLPKFRIKKVVLDTSILHHAFMLIFIAFWAVILLVVPYLCLFSLILQGLFEEGEFPPGGGNRRHRHHQHSSRRRGVISINIFISTISSPNPSSSLVTNLRLATPIGTCKVASSVDYSL